MKKPKTRTYISIYFEDGLLDHRKKRDLTISFNADDPLYGQCKEMSSAEIKELIEVSSYNELVKLAEKENRTLGNFVKHKLRQKIA